MNQSAKPRYFKVLLICFVLVIASYAIAGVITGTLGIAVHQYDSISPPQALLHYSYFSFFSRLFDQSSIPGGWIWPIRFLILVPIPGLIFYILYCLLARKRSSWKKTILWMSISLPSFVIMMFLSFIFIPASIILGMYRVKASLDVAHARNLIKNVTIETDLSQVTKDALTRKDLRIFSDYGSGGALLAVLIDENPSEKLSYYESFYLPIFLSENKPLAEVSDIDNSPLSLVDKNALIFGQGVTIDLMQKILPDLAKKMLTNTYGNYISNSSNQLEKFLILKPEDYKVFYDLKIYTDIQANIAENKSFLQNNQKIIQDYPSVMQQLDADYKKYVTDQQAKYDDGCTRIVIYYDCATLLNLINSNKATEDQNKASVEYNYKQSIVNNVQIEADIASDTKRLSDFQENKSSLENNKSEYSAGVTFDGNTIYLIYPEKDPMNAETMRVVMHEMTHLYSYNREKGGVALPEPLNEGLTDYLATKALGYSELDSVRASGYPLEIQVAMALLEKIPPDDMLHIYFTQDVAGFKKLMNKYFPNVDYDEFLSKYQSIFDATYHLNGAYHDFNKELIDHPDVESMRVFLGLGEKKFDYIPY